MSKTHISIACPSGGVRAAAYIGAIKALEENGFSVEAIISNSGGAVFSAAHFLNIDLNTFFNKNTALILWKYFNHSSELKKLMHKKNLQDLPVKLFVQCTDFDNLTCKVFEKGNMYKILKASSNHNIYSPFKINKNNYLDGGISCGFGVEYLRNKGYKNILALHTGPPNFSKIKGYVKPISKLLATSSRSILLKDIEINPPEYFIDNIAVNYSAYDFKKIQEITEHGYNVIKDHMAEIKVAMKY